MITQQITESTVVRAVSDERSKLTDKEIFTSAAYKRLIHSIGKEVTGRTGRANGLAPVDAIILWEPKDNNMTAYTDNKKIVINASHPSVQALKLRYDRHLCVIGAAGHEFAHCLFTDFTKLQEQHDTFMAGQFFPCKPSENASNQHGLKEIQKLLDKGIGYRRQIDSFYRALDNVIEDAYIERSLVIKFPGIFKKAFKTYNEALYVEAFPAEIEPKDAFPIFHDLVLVSLKIGRVTFKSEPVGLMVEIMKRVKSLASRLESNVWNSNVLSRKKIVLDLILENWDLIELSVGTMQEELSGGPGNNCSLDELTSEQLEELVQAVLDALQNSCAANHDSKNRPTREKSIKVLVDMPPQDSEAAELNNEIGDSESAGNGSASSKDANGENTETDRDSSGISDSRNAGDNGTGGGASAHENTDEKSTSDGSTAKNKETERYDDCRDEKTNPPAETTRSSGKTPNKENHLGETTTVIRVFSENDAASGTDELRESLSRIETELARAQAEKSVNHQLRSVLQQNANESTAKDSYTILINRNTMYPQNGELRYQAIWPQLRYYAKNLKSEILKVLKTRRTGGKISGLAIGRRINSRQLHREDECYFSRNKLPDDRPRVAVSILIDESGSMNRGAKDSSGAGLFRSKIEAATNAALILYDFCIALGFPVMVAGHTTGETHTVIIDALATFQRIDSTDRFRIAGADATGGNRDGTALNYCLYELKKRPEEVKLLFILSDGLPSHYSTYEKGIEHLKEVAKAAKDANVQLYAAALDEDVETIMTIYGDRAFEMTDLARMPKSLLGIMKKYIR